MAIKRVNVAPPSPPMETVELEGVGEVIVRGLMLRDRLALMSTGGEAIDKVAPMLAATVVDDDRQPLWTAEQWEAFGARNFDACLRLFDVAQRLSGLKPEEPGKK